MLIMLFLTYLVHETSLLILDPDEILKPHEQNFLVLTSVIASLGTKIELITKSYDDNLHENNRNRRDLSSVFNDQDKEFDKNKLTKSGSIAVIRNPSSDNELVEKMLMSD